jgi:hypothetical protein
MKLPSVDLNVRHFGREIERFLANTDRKHWEKLIKKIEATEGIFFKSYLLRRNPLIHGIQQYLYLCRQGQVIWKHRSPEIELLVRNAFIINRLLYSLNESAKKQILGRLRNDDIRSLLHELSIATHFFRNGCDVVFVEHEGKLEGNGTYDLHVLRNSLEAEVECKYKSYDAGRKIKRAALYLLCDEIIKQLGNYHIRCLIEIDCMRTLGQNRSTIISVVDKLKSAIDRREQRISFNKDFSINVNYLPEKLVIKSDEEVRTTIEPFVTPQSHFATVSNDEMTVIIKVESEERDKVLRAIYGELKQALDQFSKTNPGLISCYIEGIYPEQWQELQGDNGLAAMTTYLLDREKADHIHTIAYSSEIEVTRMGYITDHTHPVLFFRNPNCSFHRGEDIFSLKTDIFQI